ncbi:response regulator transcription factor [Companilactobacillus heilongjiangensis]|uniref:LuxR family transcriptional regulator n=1 Tax=Companilactobacillus heilongjiangensis TaxID=1074467 RepID=A0A0K2L9V3_9LACO|nr:response regulator transcription factor [Companilactobacillus heilongjiangensis]ALB28056.1 LuxR family transcriptional regulator [Companilactobacillus heilongjiangensis]
MIKMIIADDQAIVREGLSLVLGFDDEIEIVLQAKNGQEAVEYLKDNECDIVLMDIKMPVLNGVEATKIIHQEYPNVKILILTTFNDYEYIFQALKNGANGYLLKDTDGKELIADVKKVYNNESIIGSQISNSLVAGLQNNSQQDMIASLTSRELEIARAIADGKSNKEISTMLFLSEGTVKNYVTNIFEKLQLSNRTEVALFMKKYE